MDRTRRAYACCLAIVATTVGVALVAPAASATSPTNLTWTGGSTGTSPDWSTSGNWGASPAPIAGDSLGTVAFAPLVGCGSGCGAQYSEDDISSLTANALSIDDDGGYNISTTGPGISLALGSGGSPPPRGAPPTRRPPT